MEFFNEKGYLDVVVDAGGWSYLQMRTYCDGES